MTGTTVSDSAEVLQDEVDAIRDEYVAFGTSRVPARSEFGTARSDHLKPSEINKADFSVYIADKKLLSGFEDVRTTLGKLMDREVFLTVNSGYRNPVHHRVHGGSGTVDSQHQYGTAIDLRIWDQGETRERFFGLVKLAAHDAAGCFEPEKAIRAANEQGVLTHAHIDWRAKCPKDWR